MVRSHLDYCSSFWAPYRIGDTKAIERYRKELQRFYWPKKVPYVEKLKICKLTTLHYIQM